VARLSYQKPESATPPANAAEEERQQTVKRYIAWRPRKSSRPQDGASRAVFA